MVSGVEGEDSDDGTEEEDDEEDESDDDDVEEEESGDEEDEEDEKDAGSKQVKNSQTETESGATKRKLAEEMLGDRFLTDEDFRKIKRRQLIQQVETIRGTNKIKGQKRKLSEVGCCRNSGSVILIGVCVDSARRDGG